MESQHARREMQLQCREAVDHGQLSEMVLARSLALDRRELLLAQKERELNEASTKTFCRYLCCCRTLPIHGIRWFPAGQVLGVVEQPIL